MDTIQIRLPNYDNQAWKSLSRPSASWNFNKDFFLQLFPDSFIGLALQVPINQYVDWVPLGYRC